MDRRTFIARGVGVTGTIGLAGCLGLGLFGGGSSSPPPRRSTVFGEIEAEDERVVVPLVDGPTVHSRAEVGAANVDGGPVGSLAPIGVARGQKGGRGGGSSRGASGRGSRSSYRSAPKRRGRAVYGARDDDDDWREDHEGEIRQYDAGVEAVGLGRLAGLRADEATLPGPGRPDEFLAMADDPGGRASFGPTDPGWYRVAGHLVHPSGHDFGWTAIDFELERDDGKFDVGSPWKVSPSV
ncbi:hypothetical protein BRD17_00515 [Halobacteriales archaeon SW_7_68_16]|nr:MAG: hypothetical protein BRD17_00515 [Halobacteriales archaeon SW_7_68_16]